MKRFPRTSVALIILASAGLAVLTPDPLLAQSVDEAVLSVERHYQGVSDLTGNVIQKNFLKTLGKTQTFEGRLWIKKPGKLKLEYANGQLILIDGKAALFYSKKSEQVIKKTFSDFEHMNVPVAFLLGAAHIRNDFDVLQPDPRAPRQLELIPRKSGAAMKKLQLDSDESGRVTGLTIHDRSGNVTEIRFAGVRENAGLEDRQFTFTAPKGTEVIEQ